MGRMRPISHAPLHVVLKQHQKKQADVWIRDPHVCLDYMQLRSIISHSAANPIAMHWRFDHLRASKPTDRVWQHRAAEPEAEQAPEPAQ